MLNADCMCLILTVAVLEVWDMFSGLAGLDATGTGDLQQ